MDWKSAFLLQRYQLDPKFYVEGVVSTNHSTQITRLNDVSYGVKTQTDFSSILSQFTCLTDRWADGRTDGQTPFSWLVYAGIQCSAVKMDELSCVLQMPATVVKECSETYTDIHWQFIDVVLLGIWFIWKCKVTQHGNVLSTCRSGC